MMVMSESKQRKRRNDASQEGDSLPPVPHCTLPMAADTPCDVSNAVRTDERGSAPKGAAEKRSPTPQQEVVIGKGAGAVPRPGMVMRTSMPQEEVPVVKSSMDVPNKVLSSSMPVKKMNGESVPSGANRSTKSLPAYPDGMGGVEMLLQTNAPGGFAVPTNRSSEERRQARDALMGIRGQDGTGLKSGNSQTPPDLTAKWHGPPARQAPARSASGSLADGTEGELQAVSDEDDEEAADGEEEDNENEDSEREHPGMKPTRRPASSDGAKKPALHQQE